MQLKRCKIIPSTNAETRIKEFACFFKQHAEEQCKDENVLRAFVHESEREEKLKSLKEVKNEEQSFTVFHEETTKDDCTFVIKVAQSRHASV